MARLYGRAGRLTAQNGGFWPGQFLLPDELYGLLPLGLSADTDFNTASEQSCL